MGIERGVCSARGIEVSRVMGIERVGCSARGIDGTREVGVKEKVEAFYGVREISFGWRREGLVKRPLEVMEEKIAAMDSVNAVP
jgi:hypothetical protein